MHLWQLDVANMGGFFCTKNKSARAQGRFLRERRFLWCYFSTFILLLLILLSATAAAFFRVAFHILLCGAC